MKTLLPFGLLILAISFLNTAMALTGNPNLVNEEQADAQMHAPTYQTSDYGSNYYYVQIKGKQQICYNHEKSPVKGVNGVTVNAQIGHTIQKLYCYDANQEYFEKSKVR